MRWKEGDRPVLKDFVTKFSQFAANYSQEQSMTPGNYFLQIVPSYFGQHLQVCQTLQFGSGRSRSSGFDPALLG